MSDALTVVYGDFEWDEAKARANERKHGIAFEEATTALVDPRAIEAPDHSDPDRFVSIGMSAFLRVLFVVHTERTHGRTHIVSARKASSAQRRLYEEG